MEEKKTKQEEMNLDVSLDVKDVTSAKDQTIDEKVQEKQDLVVEDLKKEEPKVQIKDSNVEEEHIFKDEKKDERFIEKTEFTYPLPQTSLEENLKTLNEYRQNFLEFNNSSNRVKKYVLFTFVGIIGIFAIVMLINHKSMASLFTPLVLIFFVFILITFLLIKRSKIKLNVAFDGYKSRYFNTVDSYVFYQTGISNLELSYNSKISLEEINKIFCYDQIIKTLTRDVVVGSFFGVPFLGYDLLLKTGTDPNDNKTMSTIFSGKMFHIDLINKKAGKMVIYLKGCGDSEPTNLAGLEPVEIKDLKSEYKVYTDYENPTSALNKKAIDTLNTFMIDKVIEDIIITISKEGIYFGLSLTTENMMIPYKEEIDGTFLNHYKEDIEKIKTFISDLLGNKNYQIKLDNDNN